VARTKREKVSGETPDGESSCVAAESVELANRIALGLSEAAAAIGVSPRHLRSHLSEVPHVYLGERLLFPVDALREWLGSSARQQASESNAIADAILSTMGR